jgi:GAF domain-containing protein
VTRLRVAESPCPQCYADELQYEGGYGPCVDAGRAGQMFLVDDMRTEQRWPDYAQNVAADGVLSSLSVPLPFQGVTIGGLNTYAAQPKAFNDSDVVAKLAAGDEFLGDVA